MAATDHRQTVKKVYIINVLTVWRGDHFNESYDYRFMGVTTDKEFADYLRSLKVSKDVAEHSEWPKYHMAGFPWYEIEEVDELTLGDIKVGRYQELAEGEQHGSNRS